MTSTPQTDGWASTSGTAALHDEGRSAEVPANASAAMNATCAQPSPSNWKFGLPADHELGQMVEVRGGLGDEVMFHGRLIAMTDEPTITVQLTSGEKRSWIAALGWQILDPTIEAQQAAEQESRRAEAALAEQERAGVWVCHSYDMGPTQVRVFASELDALRESQQGGYYQTVVFLPFGEVLK